MDQLNELGKEMNSTGSTLLAVLGSPDDYARLLTGHAPPLDNLTIVLLLVTPQIGRL
jgi:hypothetical protein